MTKLQLGHALVLEAPLPQAGSRNARARSFPPTKQSFADKGVPKLELGNESGSCRPSLRAIPEPLHLLPMIPTRNLRLFSATSWRGRSARASRARSRAGWRVCISAWRRRRRIALCSASRKNRTISARSWRRRNCAGCCRTIAAISRRRWLRGGWTAHFTWKTKPEETCLDIFGIAPRGSSAWEQEMLGLYASRHTVAEMKRTNREKDWPYITVLGIKRLKAGDRRGLLISTTRRR